MPLTYAAEEDLPAEIDGQALPDSATVDRYLRTASGLVTRAIRRDRYETTSGGLPTDPDLAAALRDATVEQVTQWVAANIDPLKAGVVQPDRQVKSKSRGGASVTYTDDDPGVTARRAAAAGDLCDTAVVILQNAGFLSGQPGYAGW